MKRFFASLVLAIAAAAAAIFTIHSFRPKYNILILSVDSYRRFPGEDPVPPSVAPNLARFARGSERFPDFVTQFSWSNLDYWLARVNPADFKRAGYDPLGVAWRLLALRKVDAQELNAWPAEFYMYVPHEHFDYGLRLLRARLLAPHERPFFLQVHFKELHPPLYRPGITKDGDLTPASRARLRKYLEHPERFGEKAILFHLLFDPMLGTFHQQRTTEAIDALAAHGRIDPRWNEIKRINFEASPLFLELWRHSEGYEEDLALIDELYLLKLRAFDASIGELLDLYGDKELAAKTVVIVLGNFGFSLMQHGQLFNSVGVYEEFNGSNLTVRLPGQDRGRVWPFQTSLKSVVRFVAALMESGPSQKALENLHDPDVFIRNYTADKFALREEGRWKLVMDLDAGTKELFDLSADPGERKDVKDENPAVFARLYRQWLKEALHE
jgi:hypothetical protein